MLRCAPAQRNHRCVMLRKRPQQRSRTHTQQGFRPGLHTREAEAGHWGGGWVPVSVVQAGEFPDGRRGRLHNVDASDTTEPRA